MDCSCEQDGGIELKRVQVRKRKALAKIGNGPNTVWESTVSNTELSEFFGAH